MPGQPACAYALPIFPRQFTLENCQSATGVTAIIHWQALRIATYSLNPLSGRMFRPAIEKRLSLVKKLWTIGLPCGRLRKSANKPRHKTWNYSAHNNLDVVKAFRPLPSQIDNECPNPASVPRHSARPEDPAQSEPSYLQRWPKRKLARRWCRNTRRTPRVSR
jgi:hypothetical protein